VEGPTGPLRIPPDLKRAVAREFGEGGGPDRATSFRGSGLLSCAHFFCVATLLCPALAD
jgi:hypothetical protein